MSYAELKKVERGAELQALVSVGFAAHLNNDNNDDSDNRLRRSKR